MMTPARVARRALPLLALASALSACQPVEIPVRLTPAQEKEILLKEAPKPQYPVGAMFNDTIELIGFDVTQPLVAGKKATFTWYWRAKKDVAQDWRIFVHFDTRTFRNNLDHYPADKAYPTRAWKAGQIIRDVQQITIHPNTPSDEATPYIGLYAGDVRMDITNGVKKTNDRRVIGPKLKILNPKQPATPPPSRPSYAVRALTSEEVAPLKIDGKLDEPLWARIPTLNLTPYGRVPEQKTWAKAFVTDAHLVVGARLEDRHIWGTLRERDSKTWTEEVLELFIDVNGDGKDYLEFQITPHNVVFDARFPQNPGVQVAGTTREQRTKQAMAFNIEGLETAVHVEGTLDNPKDQDTAWSVEIKIPLAQVPGLTLPIKPGAQWAVNLYRFDRPDAANPKKSFAYAWSRLARADFHDVKGYGRWRMLGPVRAVVVDTKPSKDLKEALRKQPTPLPPVKPPTPASPAPKP